MNKLSKATTQRGGAMKVRDSVTIWKKRDGTAVDVARVEIVTSNAGVDVSIYDSQEDEYPAQYREFPKNTSTSAVRLFVEGIYNALLALGYQVQP